ncbi:MAG: hypothetical protein ABL984_03325 [Pyrinomonadaceae bacterium]
MEEIFSSLQGWKAILAVLNLGVQIGLLLLLISLVKKNARVALSSELSSSVNRQILDLNAQQLQLVDEQIRLAQETVEIQYRPRLVAFLLRDHERPGDNLLLVIRNIGNGLAEDVCIRVTHQLDADQFDRVHRLFELLPDLKSLPPGYQFYCPFERAGKFVHPEEGVHTGFDLAVEYKDGNTRAKYQEIIALDLGSPTGLCKQ